MHLFFLSSTSLSRIPFLFQAAPSMMSLPVPCLPAPHGGRGLCLVDRQPEMQDDEVLGYHSQEIRPPLARSRQLAT
ncbi:hypothetical protein F5883DRAFT_27138 [Diaporthe sp. PMI_573]|nr:hypothetical protein F5883DRAFT_27138 [Diaporthaceae sp. PMI_573]